MILHDVIIPARGETLDTLAPTIAAFLQTRHINRVIVVEDGLDKNVIGALSRNTEYGKRVMFPYGPHEGKGQAVMTGLRYSTTRRVIFCDGDLTGFTPDHATSLVTHVRDSMIIGVPDVTPGHPPWPVSDQIRALVSGERSIPRWLIRWIDLHGYCMEVQINHAAMHAKLRTRIVHLNGCQGTPRWTPERIAEMERDKAWLDAHPLT